MKIEPDLILTVRLNSNDPDFNKIVARIREYPSRNLAGLDALRAFVGTPIRFATPTQSAAPQSETIVSQLDYLNERLDMILDKLERLQAVGISPSSVSEILNTEISPDLAEEIRREFMAKNG